MQQEVTDALRDAITSGGFPPGARLLEQDLARELGVSRAPIREAFRLLTGEGLVVTVPHKGTSVVELGREDTVEIFRLRAAIEPVAVERLIELDNPEHRAELREIIDLLRASLPERDPVTVASLDMRFHERMCELAEMPRLLQAWRALGNQLRTYFTIAEHFYDDDAVVSNHEQVVQAIESRDIPYACDVIHRHILGGGELMATRWATGREA